MRKLKIKYHTIDGEHGNKMYLYGTAYMNVEVSESVFNTMLANSLELQARELRDQVASIDALNKVKLLEAEVAALSRDKKRGKR